MIRSISILGCGWLGLPLAEFLASHSHAVKGSTTQDSKLNLIKQAGVQPFLIKLTPSLEGNKLSDFFSSDILIINIPPAVAKTSEDFHVQQMEALAKYLKNSPERKIIYVSSTSVYPDMNAEVRENDIERVEDAGNKTLFRAEEILKSYNTIILRCAGLAGYDRNIVKYFAGKKNLSMGNCPVNLIHRDDVIEIIFQVIQKDNLWNNIFNVSAPEHPLRKDLYPSLAQKFNYEIPHYALSLPGKCKIVNADKLINELNYQFKFPNPFSFLYNK
ncbi:MAG: SDR family NAD(P)-dependent oxidoreductase [Cytophagaceae bacterium]|nr:SDR family NAD(P)-dependent oxidoreductase [Cytophagaceae bacterium]